ECARQWEALAKGNRVSAARRNLKEAGFKEWDEWLRRRFRMYIWKQWKKPGTRVENLRKLGISAWQARGVAYSRKAYWRSAKHGAVNTAISNERLAQAGYNSILDRYESLHLCG
ncbi:MAG: group II intron reverse transcriptase/maturase, partial [Kiritimatiellae bacterium]|nr:group II intron reverse transcriptase/maturase [Kiritimatiellia bacterium]